MSPALIENVGFGRSPWVLLRVPGGVACADLCLVDLCPILQATLANGGQRVVCYLNNAKVEPIKNMAVKRPDDGGPD